MTSSYENAPSTTLLATHCALCGRPLRDADSVERGVGPDCAEKHGYGDAQGEADWDRIGDLLTNAPTSLFEAVVEQWGDRAQRNAANVIVHHAATVDRAKRRLHVDLLVALGYTRLAVALEAAAGEVVRIQTQDGGALVVKAPYNPSFTAGIKAARVGARWSDADKAWLVPRDAKAKVGLYRALLAAFPGVLLEGPKGPVRLTKAVA